MPARPSPHLRFATLPALALLALVLVPSCASVSAQDHRGIGPHQGARPKTPPAKAAPAPNRRAFQGRPDPRYRPAKNFAELQAVAGEVAKATGRKIRWRLQLGPAQGPLVKVRGTLNDCTITLHPVAAQKVPPNTWAYLFGHEFAHLVEELGTHSATSPANELKADIAGARYAMAAGYRLDAFLGWVLTEPNQNTATHGSLHQRVQQIAKRYGVSQKAIQAEAQRYRQYRATH